jgi:hypothetical protein
VQHINPDIVPLCTVGAVVANQQVLPGCRRARKGQYIHTYYLTYRFRDLPEPHALVANQGIHVSSTWARQNWPIAEERTGRLAETKHILLCLVPYPGS